MVLPDGLKKKRVNAKKNIIMQIYVIFRRFHGPNFLVVNLKEMFHANSSNGVYKPIGKLFEFFRKYETNNL